MRPLPLAVLLLAVAAPPVASAEEVVRLKVGESKPGVGTVRPLCDAPAVAVIAAGVLQAVGPGETVCSAATVQAQGIRRVYRVIVTRPDPSEGPDGRPVVR
jgi:hypothetical protein